MAAKLRFVRYIVIVMMQVQFTKLARSVLVETENRRLFEHVAKHVAHQVEDRLNEPALERLALMPVEARTVYWLWRFQCEAGICGMDVFVLEALGKYAPQVHAALDELGARDLLQLLESAIALARREAAEFKTVPDQTWFEQFPESSAFPVLESINRPAFTLLSALDKQVIEYINQKKTMLFETTG